MDVEVPLDRMNLGRQGSESDATASFVPLEFLEGRAIYCTSACGPPEECNEPRDGWTGELGAD